MFLLYRFRSTCVANDGNSLRKSTISPATWKPTSNRLKPIAVTSPEKKSAVPIRRNATKNPTTTRLPVPFVVNILIEEKTCSVTLRSTKDLEWGQGWRDLHPLDHPIVLQNDYAFTVHSLPTVRSSVSHLSNMNPKSPQKTRRPVSYI